MVMKKEYGRYKDQWGQNLHFSHSAGPAKNFSELSHVRFNFLIHPNFYIFKREEKNQSFKWSTSTLTLRPLTVSRKMQRCVLFEELECYFWKER